MKSEAGKKSYHKLSGLNQHRFIIRQFWRSKGSMGSNPGVSSAVFLWRLRGEYVSSPWQILEATHDAHLWPLLLLVASSSIIWSSPSHDTISQIFSLLPPSSTYRDPCDDIGPTPNTGSSPHVEVSWFADLMPSATLIPLHQVTYHTHRFWGVGCG